MPPFLQKLMAIEEEWSTSPATSTSKLTAAVNDPPKKEERIPPSGWGKAIALGGAGKIRDRASNNCAFVIASNCRWTPLAQPG